MDRSQTRVVDPVAKQLRLGLVGFAVAAVGVTLGFLVDYGPDNPLAYGAFGLAATGVTLGFVAVAWGWVASCKFTASRARSKNDDAR